MMVKIMSKSMSRNTLMKKHTDLVSFKVELSQPVVIPIFMMIIIITIIPMKVMLQGIAQLKPKFWTYRQ